MINKDVLDQYDNIGEAYINNQRMFFASKDDWSRNQLRAHLIRVGNGKILDIGCGAGDDIKWCEENALDAYGIDPSKKMCQLAKNFVSSPEKIMLGDFENIPFPDSSFDLVMGRFSLHYLKDFSKAYVEISRVLKKDGIVLLIVSHPTYDSVHQSETADEMISVRLYDGKVTVRFPRHSLADYFSDTFLGLFDLRELNETNSVDADNPRRVPETLFYAAVKR